MIVPFCSAARTIPFDLASSALATVGQHDASGALTNGQYSVTGRLLGLPQAVQTSKFGKSIRNEIPLRGTRPGYA